MELKQLAKKRKKILRIFQFNNFSQRFKHRTSIRFFRRHFYIETTSKKKKEVKEEETEEMNDRTFVRDTSSKIRTLLENKLFGKGKKK